MPRLPRKSLTVSVCSTHCVKPFFPSKGRQFGGISRYQPAVYPDKFHSRYIPINEAQHQQRVLDKQSQELAALKAQNAYLRAVVEQQQRQDAALAARLERLEAASTATLAGR